MKKFFLLTCFYALISAVYSQKTDSISDTYLGYDNLERAAKSIDLTFKVPENYTTTGQFDLKYPPANPKELLRTTFGIKAAKWIHEDGECILFIQCHGMKSGIDKSIDEFPKDIYSVIRNTLSMGYFNKPTTEEQMEKLNKILTFWSPEKAKETFNAQYVITYPIKEKKSVYMGKFTHKLELIMVKWGERLSISFLVTKKGNKNIQKYIKDMESAFWFND